MCGRYTIAKPKRVLAVFAPRTVTADLGHPRYNIAPMQKVPVVTGPRNERTISDCQWGLVPGWADNPSIGSRMINARGETVEVKPAFKQAFRTGRCLLPADGFYEWRSTGRDKQPFWIHAPEDEPFAFAGLCAEWRNRDTGSILKSCTILTREADGSMAGIHDRMPVIVPDSMWDAWLDTSRPAGTLLAEVLAASRGRPLVTTMVSKLVNSPANDSEKCISPVADDGSA
ncbi:MAG: SOS response-associated peptidase [bacterium]